MKKELNIIYNYFPNKVSGTVVECGTAEGYHEPSVSLEKSGWKFYGFEPDPRFYSILLKTRPSGTNLPFALSDKNELVEFEISAWGGNSSLKHCNFHKNELMSYDAQFDDGTKFKKIWVTSITWESFIKRYNIGHVDLFILDVEGSELSVINGMRKSQIWPDVLCVEFGYSDHKNSLMNERKKENFSGFKIIKDILKPLGYEFDYLNHNNLMFSKKTFWVDKEKPSDWFGEDTEFHHLGYCFYDKEKCKKL